METTFLSLPNEILTKFFENLSMKDRQSLASINDRLSEVERKSGGRRFDRINFNNVCLYPFITYRRFKHDFNDDFDIRCIFQDSDDFIIATFASDRKTIRKTFSRTDPLQEVAAFFNHALTHTLQISVSFEVFIVRYLNWIEFNLSAGFDGLWIWSNCPRFIEVFVFHGIVFRDLGWTIIRVTQFNIVRVNMLEKIFRVFNELLQRRQCFKGLEFIIRKKADKFSVKGAKHLFMNLPKINFFQLIPDSYDLWHQVWSVHSHNKYVIITRRSPNNQLLMMMSYYISSSLAQEVSVYVILPRVSLRQG